MKKKVAVIIIVLVVIGILGNLAQKIMETDSKNTLVPLIIVGVPVIAGAIVFKTIRDKKALEEQNKECQNTISALQAQLNGKVTTAENQKVVGLMHIETLKVCKECGKSGLDLHLNESLLCDECAEAQKMIMEHGQFVCKLGKARESGDFSEIEAYMKARDKVLSDQRDRTLKNGEYLYNNLMKGKELEKQGRTEEALALYYENLKYLPQGTDYYTRPCIVLEKKKEYDKAIEICDLAIDVIEKYRFHADVNEFIHRKNRLLAKKAKAVQAL